MPVEFDAEIAINEVTLQADSDISTPGVGDTSYLSLTEKPQINGVTLVGNKSTEELNIDHVLVADNLSAHSGTTDTTPYTLRSAPSYAGSVAELKKIVGGTLGWNQLCNAASVTLTSGHKYFMMKSGTASVASSDGTAITGLTSGTDMVIDLTQMFGSTVADAINTMETTTAGSGVAFFRSLFPSVYYPYSAPTLESVQTSARKALDGNGNTVRTYPLDSDLTLRGIPKLVNGALQYDGDEYLPNGTVTRKYAQITIDGTEADIRTTTYSHIYCVVYTDFTNAPKHGTLNVATSPLYVPATYSYATMDGYEFAVCLRNSESGTLWRVYLRTPETTLENLKTYLGNHPLTLVYELDTPTTETADPYAEVQLAGETEQFVCDNYIPVGNESFYPTDLTGVVQNLAPLPTTAGTYKLQVTVSGGVPSYSWVAG